MAKNPNRKSLKRDNSLYGAFIFFFAACIAELYLLVLRKYYVNGSVEEILGWHDRLPMVAGLGAAVLVLGVALSVLWKADERKRLIGWAVAGVGVFFAAGTLLIWRYFDSAIALLSVVVPVVMVLSVLWAFYDREYSVSLTILSVTLIVLWVCRRLFTSQSLGVAVKVGSVVYVLLLGGLCWMAKNNRLQKFFGPGVDYLSLYVVCGLSAVGIVLALFSAVVAYYAMWALAVVLFALAVYYTVKLL